jgi:hypothetical protein
MKNFEEWFKELCSNYVWYEPAIQHHEPETFRQAANKVYMQYVASEIFPPIQEARKHVYNVLCKITPDKKIGKDWVTKALEKHEQEKQEEWIPVTGEERQRRLAELRALIDSMPMINNFPRVTEVEKAGQVLPPKAEPYPITTPEEAYVRDRHFEWIKTCFEPRTGEKNLNYVPEDDFNIWYDVEYLNRIGK